jgi:hypothetical protein
MLASPSRSLWDYGDMIEDFTIYLLWSLAQHINHPAPEIEICPEMEYKPYLKMEAAHSSRKDEPSKI